MNARFARLLLSGAALFVAVPAYAIEPQAAAEALAAAMTGGDSTATFDSATMNGSDVVITGLKITRTDDTSDTMTFAETVIASPTEGGDGVFDSPTITFTNGALAGEATGTIASAVLTGVTVLEPEAEAEGPMHAVRFATMETTDIRLTPPEQQGALTIARIAMETGNVVDGVPQDNSGSVEGLLIPAALWATAPFQPSMIGYEDLVFGVTWDGTMETAADKLTVRDFTISLQDGGAISVDGVLGQIPDPGQLNDPAAAEEASKMEIHNMTIHYQDSSLAGRILDLLAQQQGMDRATYASQIAGALPFLLASLNNPEFTGEVSTALQAFLQDPQSLTITLAPETPVTGAEISSLVQTAPQTLPDRLNASVTANTPR